MGNDKLTNKQLELLNSCLDGELRGDEITNLAELLAADPDAAAEMADLLKVKSMLKEMPTVKPPRNYRLTTIEAEEARPKPFWERLFPLLRGACAFCALALAFVFIFPLFSADDAALEAAGSPPMLMAKSVPPDYAASEAIADEQIVLAEDLSSASNSALPASMPSYGVRGGSPRSEYLMMEAERLQQLEQETSLPDETDSGMDTLTIAKISLAFLLLILSAAVIRLGQRKKKLELKNC